jgi:hypothetical protein
MDWKPIETAQKDGTPVLMCFKKTLPPDPIAAEMWGGLQAVMRHTGVKPDGFDIGWQFAAPVGHGGFPDDWFEGWQPLPEPPEAA